MPNMKDLIIPTAKDHLVEIGLVRNIPQAKQHRHQNVSKPSEENDLNIDDLD